MRPVRVPLLGLAPGERDLPAEAAHYVVDVLRLGPGDAFVAFDPEAHVEADGVVVHGSTVRIGPVTPARVLARGPLTVVYALAKGDKVDATVRDATELGATRVVLAETTRTIVKLSGRADQKRERWQRIVAEAARQSGRADPPELVGPLPWAEALAAAGGGPGAYCLDPHAVDRLGRTLPDRVREGAPLAFAIGPEGGLAPEEVTRAEALGFQPASLGPIVLRTETVTAAVLGAVAVLRDA